MQDIHSIGGGGGGRLFGGGGGGGGDRRLRPHHHHHQGHGPQALKCPRCESLNTKFCYYNNYNLSQPRHFCKSCRRYWTKGGVLRNVPVGGGCRKTKRSSKPKSSTTTSSCNRSSETTTAAVRKSSTNSQNSSSDSSSLTATTTTTATTATAPVAAAEVLSTNSAPTTMLNFQESATCFLNPNPSFDHTLLDHHHSSTENNSIFPEIGTFTSLIASSTTAQLPLGFNSSPFRLQQQQHHHQWMHTDHTIGDELKVPETSSLLGTEDWNNGGATDQALFDLTGTVDQSYWNQTQWEEDDNDHGNHQLNYHLP